MTKECLENVITNNDKTVLKNAFMALAYVIEDNNEKLDDKYEVLFSDILGKTTTAEEKKDIDYSIEVIYKLLQEGEPTDN